MSQHLERDVHLAERIRALPTVTPKTRKDTTMSNYPGDYIDLDDTFGDDTDDTDEGCLEDGDGTCAGPIEYHSTDPGRRPAFPRCASHWARRLNRRENSMERYADSSVAPSWFDPSAAGESWDED